MKRTSRVLAAVAAATALTFTGVHTADAKPAHAGSHAKAEKPAKATSGKGATAKSAATRIARDVARLQARLDRTVSPQRLARLDAEDAAAVTANVAADKLLLDGVLAAAGDAVDVKAVRAELRTFRVANYRIAVNILRHAVKAEAAATEAGDAEAVALVESAVAKALAITATSPKADVKAARADLTGARDLLEPVEEPVVTEPIEEPAPVVTEPVVTEPVVTEPVVTEPVVAEPAPGDTV